MRAAGSHQCSRCREQRAPRRDQPGESFGPGAPRQVGIRPLRAGAGARRIDQYRVGARGGATRAIGSPMTIVCHESTGSAR